ncbi:MAG: LysM peptidoglycan-binding domain-containing protein [Alistipes sp.]|nr:LysM peptidoglycan-binding domain-containing protein [Alistipes sp.]
MKRVSLLLAMLFMAVTMAFAIEPSNIVVTVNGKLYHKHFVERGQTLYAIAKAYEVAESEIMECNVGLTAENLRAGETILVPHTAENGKERKVQDVAPKTVDKKKFLAHTVIKGDTLYSIARKYKISIAQLERDNPDIDIDNLAVGDILLVRRAERGYASADDIERELAARQSRQSIASQASDGGLRDSEHRVTVGETVYSLSRRAGMSEEEFMALNGLSSYSDLKIGMVVRLKAEKHSPIVEIASEEDRREPRGEKRRQRDEVREADTPDTIAYGDSPLEVESVADGDAPRLDVEFKPLETYHTLQLAMLLPFHNNEKVNPYFVDFYRGVLLAMEDLKAEGYDINLSVFDTYGREERVDEIVANEEAFHAAQLIIGPVYEGELSRVVGFAEERGIPVISPLADIVSLQSPVLFQMQAEGSYKSAKLANIFDGSREIVKIYANSVDGDFNSEVSQLAAGASVTALNYHFDRGSFFYVRNADGSSGEEIDITEFMCTKSPKAFVIVAKSDTDVDRILTTLASTKSSVVARSMGYGDYVVVGNRKWKQSATIEKQSFFRNNTIFIVPYYANRSDESIRIFDSRYVKAFDALPTMYSYRGYDAAMIFCRKMFQGIDAQIFEEIFKPLATPYNFVYEGGHYLNNYWIKEQYNGNFTISVE